MQDVVHVADTQELAINNNHTFFMDEKKDYTPEQTEVLETIYGYSDKANYSEEELAIAREMFDKPEKFALLRKILQVLTPDERGLTLKNPQAFVDADIKDLQKYALETAVNNLADEKVRQSLYAFYRLMRSIVVADKKAEFDAANQESFEEEQRSEEFKQEEQQEKRTLGENL